MRNRPAFSVVEVLVALVLLSIAVLGSTATIGLAARAQRNATARREAVNALEHRLASLSLAACDSIAASTAVINGVSVTTAVARSDSLVALVVSTSHKGTATSLTMEVACQ
jgi:Tfp pilus assembly protein PilV